ncbi:phosphatase PAP2 family protein [Pseudogemmobacter bohemicus]|uniref:phosphatase PAP2 family protein n=1 Tax=Pseudogemmobacter bohemicus TaxID=2250708 RepID=UPI000DD49CEB|nr:phosphatase PAP2 family protein [Pseudogemmobacter bohemicus]
MTGFFRATFLYMLAATVLTSILLDDPLGTLVGLTRIVSSFLGLIAGASAAFVPVMLLLLWWFGRKVPLERLRPMLIVALASVWLQVGFMLFKSAIPQLVPFFADPFWAWADQVLLFGHDAWQLAHMITPEALIPWFPLVYLTTWSLTAYAFPVLVTAIERDEAVALRYLWLFFLSWVLCGNVFALAGSSVGPVYYDRQLGGDRFAAMAASFEQSGYAQSAIALLQDRLWSRSGEAMSFISAFPSVHVAVAVIVALYLRERLPRLRFAGYGFLALIGLISVYSGYHYLLDGIASLVIVLGIHAALIRGFARRAGGILPAVTTPTISPHLP